MVADHQGGEHQAGVKPSHHLAVGRDGEGKEEMTKMTFAIVSSAVILGLVEANAQSYPSRPITAIVGYAAGGPTDTIARIVTERMKSALGQSILVENVTGASGSIGTGRVARAAADGYTISIGDWSTHVINGAIYPLTYDLLQDFEPVGLLPSSPQTILSKNAVPAKDLKELIGWLKANQDKLSWGTAGAGAPGHITALLLQQLIGAQFQFVPYRGAAPAMQDLVAGQIDVTTNQASNSLPQVREGKIRAYAVTSKARLDVARDIPTADEAGLPGFYVSVWRGVWAPRQRPKDVVAKLNAAVIETLGDPAVRERIAGMGEEIPARDQQTPEALGAFQKAEIEKWWPIIKAANIKPD
jgi:tripartite-type tricarboxylate transporter receptor subunit TctC